MDEKISDNKNLKGYKKLKELIEGKEEVRKKIKDILPLAMQSSYISFIESSLTMIVSSTDLCRCTTGSLLGGIIVSASLGLRLDGPLGQAYLVPRPVYIKDPNAARYQKKYSHHEAQFQPGYKGLMDMALRNPEVADIEAHVIYQHDELSWQYGTEQFLKHKYDLNKSDRGNIIGVYTGLRYHSKYYAFKVFPISQIEEIRNRVLIQNGVFIEKKNNKETYFRKDKTTGNLYEWKQASVMPWIGHLVAMIEKTGIRLSSKYWRINAQFETAAAYSELDEAGISQNLSNLGSEYLQQPQTHTEEKTENKLNNLSEQMIKDAKNRIQKQKNKNKETELTEKDKTKGNEPFTGDPSALTDEEVENYKEDSKIKKEPKKKD